MRPALALLAAAAAIALAGQAPAACAPDQETFLSCTLSGGRKALDICLDAQAATYAFGPTGGTAELSLSVPVADVDYTPWGGIGRTIWEEVVFRNEDVTYAVFGAIRRDPGGDDTSDMIITNDGGIEVRRGEERLAMLACDPGTVDFPWDEALSEAKRAVGVCRDLRNRTWVNCE
jgi:hypothetical protein